MYIYQQIFSRLYSDVAVGSHNLQESVALSAAGILRMHLSLVPDEVDLGADVQSLSRILIWGDALYREAFTPDGRFMLEIENVTRDNVSEFWLVHTDRDAHHERRIRLATEWHDHNTHWPRVAVSPGGEYVIVDDDGIIRLYRIENLEPTGAFQMAQPETDNRTIGLAISLDGTYLAGLSRWKNIVLYNVEERRVVFVRQIQDKVGWYAPNTAHLLLSDDARLLVTVSIGQLLERPEQAFYAFNAFRREA